eukprot:g725.t1
MGSLWRDETRPHGMGRPACQLYPATTHNPTFFQCLHLDFCDVVRFQEKKAIISKSLDVPPKKFVTSPEISVGRVAMQDRINRDQIIRAGGKK